MNTISSFFKKMLFFVFLTFFLSCNLTTKNNNEKLTFLTPKNSNPSIILYESYPFKVLIIDKENYEDVNLNDIKIKLKNIELDSLKISHIISNMSERNFYEGNKNFLNARYYLSDYLFEHFYKTKWGKKLVFEQGKTFFSLITKKISIGNNLILLPCSSKDSFKYKLKINLKEESLYLNKNC